MIDDNPKTWNKVCKQLNLDVAVDLRQMSLDSLVDVRQLMKASK